jgi:hypothetical protein
MHKPSEPVEQDFTHDSDTVSVHSVPTDDPGGRTTSLETVAPAHWLPFYAAFTCAMTAVVLMFIYASVEAFNIALHGSYL